jgi:hypothetical protein
VRDGAAIARLTITIHRASTAKGGLVDAPGIGASLSIRATARRAVRAVQRSTSDP